MASRPDFQPENTHLFKDYVRFQEYCDENQVYYLIFRVINADIPDELWEQIIRNVRLFTRWFKANHVKYHFMFDIHECELIPAGRLYELQAYMKKKRELLCSHLHSSVVLTNNRIVEMLLRSAFDFVTPARPIKILLTCDSNAQKNKIGIPTDLWTSALDFLQANRLAE
jgi:hypothetical protein